jgi:hypothetical protein
MKAMFDDVDGTDVDVVNYALTLEHLENAFYRQGLEMFDHSDFEDAGVESDVTTGNGESVYSAIEVIGEHEASHAGVLSETTSLLGGEPVAEASYDFGVETVEEFLAVAQVLENTGVSAYAGAAPFIESPDLQSAALSIHSVEARHAAFLNGLNSESSFPNAFDPSLSQDEVLSAAGQFIDGKATKQMFTVTVENVSKPGTIDSKRANGAVPLSPGAWGVFTGNNPAFMAGEYANKGTELIAEDGFPGGDLPPESGGLADTLAEAENISNSGTFASPGGPADNPALFPGESATFTVMASPEDMLTMETMFVQSNDWFYGFEGLSLFDGDEPVEGDVTDELGLYDAGTEEDTAPGTGEFQKPVQGPMATDVGPSEDEPIQMAAERHPDFDVPDASDVINVTVAPENGTQSLEELSQAAYGMPFAELSGPTSQLIRAVHDRQDSETKLSKDELAQMRYDMAFEELSGKTQGEITILYRAQFPDGQA